MTRQTMQEKIQDILNADAIEYIGTTGNTAYFESTSLSDKSIRYKEEIVIGEDDSLTGECDCPALQWSKADPKTCKHIGSAIAMMKRDDIRIEYKVMSANDAPLYMLADEVEGKIKIESDDD